MKETSLYEVAQQLVDVKWVIKMIEVGSILVDYNGCG